MPTPLENLLANSDKVAFTSYFPPDKIIGSVEGFFTLSLGVLQSFGGGYSNEVHIPNPLGKFVLPIGQFYNPANPLGLYDDNYQWNFGVAGFVPPIQTIVTPTEIIFYYEVDPANIGTPAQNTIHYKVQLINIL